MPRGSNARFTSRGDDGGMQRRRFLLFSSAVAMAAPARATVQDEAWFDSARARSLPVRMRWPAGEGSCVLIVHSHGLGGNREGGDAWGLAWQQAGFAVLHLQHPGSDTEVLRSGGMRALRAAASAEQLRARAADMRFAADEIARRARHNEPGWSRVRLDALGASGHSFGAATVLALAGQRFQASNASVAEPRFKAFVAFSPAPGNVAGAFAEVRRPMLLATGSHDADALGRGITGADRAGVYDGLPSGARALLWLDGADHMSFGGNAAQPLRARWGPLQREPVAAELEAQHHERIAAVTTLWWRAHLQGDAAAALALRAPAGLGAQDRWRSD
jgi:predicted dienelactone hydrolase